MNVFQVTASASAQLHSHDYRVRLFEDEMNNLVLTHLSTVEVSDILNDARACGLAACRAGMTEWQGQFRGRAVSIAWDWLQLCDGELRTLALAAPRTNLRVLDQHGYDLMVSEEALLWGLVQRQEWRPAVAAVLRAENEEIARLRLRRPENYAYMPPPKAKQ
jgi:hypothetical protein